MHRVHPNNYGLTAFQLLLASWVESQERPHEGGIRLIQARILRVAPQDLLASCLELSAALPNAALNANAITSWVALHAQALALRTQPGPSHALG